MCILKRGVKTMFCPHCGKRIPDDVLFCPVCGNKVDDEDHDSDDGVTSEDTRQFYDAEDDGYEDDTDDELSDQSYDDNENFHQKRSAGNKREAYSSEHEDRPQYRGTSYSSGGGNGSGGHHGRNSNTPVAVAAIIAVAAVVIVLGVFLIQKNSVQSTKSESAAVSVTERAVSKKAGRVETNASSAKQMPTETPTPTPTPAATATPEATPAPTAAPTATPAPQVIIVAPTTRPTPVPTQPPTIIYLDEDYVFPYSDSYLLSDSDLAGKSAWELTVGRNEIAARHGYVFNREDLQDYFDSKDWYYPIGQFDLSSVLSSTEMRNMSFIDKYQNAHGLQTS